MSPAIQVFRDHTEILTNAKCRQIAASLPMGLVEGQELEIWGVVVGVVRKYRG